MRYLFALAIGIAAASAPAAAAAATAAVTSEDARFAAFGDRIVDEYLKLDPVSATQMGDHRYDALLPDVSAAGRGARPSARSVDPRANGGKAESRTQQSHRRLCGAEVGAAARRPGAARSGRRQGQGRRCGAPEVARRGSRSQRQGQRADRRGPLRCEAAPRAKLVAEPPGNPPARTG